MNGALVDRLRELVDELPEPERSIVNGIYWERLSYRDMARRLTEETGERWPVMTVFGRSRKAYRLIGEKLGVEVEKHWEERSAEWDAQR